LLGQMIWAREIHFESARIQPKPGWPCLAA
jgi:hypothetical protein